MKWFLRILVILILIILITGFILQSYENVFAEKVIGIGVVLIVLVLLPAFLYHRYRNKNIQDYVLDNEKWEKLKEQFKKNM
jgi:c-di-AMP phosphodiesterase-like protein